ncbi:phosphonoacetate hydrolase [Fodinicurvata sp. EGI_FJ10296]|uniref:phosphonoacetate hydrolase n=1 Tax=Fodinicurvata sp. EGI_FJ10296 TaxID=3231908 RepID=UPI0034537531
MNDDSLAMPPAPNPTADPADRPFTEVNGRVYRHPRQPVAVICADGCGPEYLEAAIAHGVAPTLGRMSRDGFHATARAVVPTFTNPNNISIVCGAPPSVHGISGNYYLDRRTGREVMMLDEAQMRADTIPGRLSQEHVRVAVVTAKRKLRLALARGLRGIACSAEDPAEAFDLINEGRPFASAPDKYSADLSLFVLDAGIRLLERRAADLIYLSLSDFVQHAHAPDTPEALAFMAALDARVARLTMLGAIVGIVADHGMTDMSHADGSPNVVFVQDVLNAAFGHGSTRVICPITDPFGRHHAALGGFVRVYAQQDGVAAGDVVRALQDVPGIEAAVVGADACDRFDLPLAEEADVVVFAEKGVALGAGAADHDLSQLAGQRLRSHGGPAEQAVPFLLSHPVTASYAARASGGLWTYDIFDYALNGVVA